MGQSLHQNGNCFRNFVPRRLLATWGFPALYFDLLTNEIEGQFVKTVNTVHLVNGIMNIENAPPKKVVRSL